MTRRRLAIAMSVLLATIAWASPVAAGNWATATMDAGPAPAAGVATPFRFVILQHGVTPAPWVTATLVATNLVTGAQIQAPMHADGIDGGFVTSITFPDAGDWTWYVLLAELGTDQGSAGGTLAVLEPAEAAAARLADLDERYGGLVPVFARWLADAAARSAAARSATAS
jgi:hypothetical protein